MQAAADHATRTLILARIRHAIPHGAGIVAPAGPARPAGSGRRLVRGLEIAVIAAGVGTALAGVLLIAYGATLILTGQDATPRPYPNTQHISTTPNPRR